MVSARAYFDWNASAPLLPAARAAMIDALDGANPSSVHSEGRAARRLVEDARASVAALSGAKREHVVFTAGATEAAATLLSPEWRRGRSPLFMSRLYVCVADHACFLSGGRFRADDVIGLPVESNGVVDIDAMTRALAGHDRNLGLPLVALHLANNETGVIQPATAIAAIVRQFGGLLVVDAVQAAGRIPLDITALDCDFLILSGHKIGGPKGVGAIVARSDLTMPVPLIAGGGQEKGHRAGTENLAGIAGFGAAARHAADALSDMEALRAKRDRIEGIISAAAPDTEFFGAHTTRLCNTTFFAIPGMKAETLQIALDLVGFAVSAGSACSSGRVGPSHVLWAMGMRANNSAIRISIGETTTDAEIDRFEVALAGILRCRKRPIEAVARAA